MVLDGEPVEVVDPGFIEILAPFIGWTVFVASIGDDLFWWETGVFELSFETVDFFSRNVDFEWNYFF